MSKHTLGPWCIHKTNNEIMVVSKALYAEPIPIYLAKVVSVAPSQGNTENNARLIAAAPELLETVEGIVSILTSCDVTSGICGCGESMSNHSRAVDCGHEPVDAAVYAMSCIFKSAQAVIAKATGASK